MINMILTILLFVILSVCGVKYADAAYERPLEHWDFTAAQDILGWSALHSVAPLTVAEGALQMKIAASDPYIGSPDIEITTGEFQYVRVTIRSEVRGGGQVFWAAGSSRQEARFNANDVANFTIVADGKFHTYYVLPFWKPGMTLYQIRIDTPEGPDKLVEISDVAIIERNVTGDAPAEPDYDFSAPGAAEFWMPYQDMETMSQEGEALKIHVSGETPAVVSPPFEISADEARFLTLQTSVTDCSQAEVWYEVGSGFSPPNRHSFQVIPDGKSHIYNIDLSEARGYDGIISRMAVSLVGASQETQWLLRSVGLNSAPSGPGEAVISSLEIESAVVFAGEPTKVYCEITNVGGEPVDQAEVEIVWATEAGDAVRKKGVEPLGASQSAICEWDVILPEQETPDPVSIEARLMVNGKVVGVRSATAVVSLPPDENPAHLVLGNEQLKLVLPRNAYGYGVGVLYMNRNGEWVRTASLKNLGALSAADGEVHHLYSRSGMAIGKKIALPIHHEKWSGTISFSLSQDAPFIEISSSISCGEDAELTSFSLPDLLVGDGSFGKDRSIGLFPGLEYLLSGERSSGLDFCAVPVNDRLVPHPNKVTIPLMSIIQDGVMAGIMWDPLQKWDGDHDRPCAKFASPNFVDDQRNHLMGLFVPSIPEWTEENNLTANKPIKIGRGKKLALNARIFAALGDDVDDVIKLWFDSTGGVPELPEMPYSYDEHIKAVIRDYTQTSWVPEESKWHRAIHDPWGPSYVPTYMLHLMWEMEREKLSAAERNRAREIFDAASKTQLETARNLGREIAFYQGSVAHLVSPPGWLSRFKRRIRDDGTFPFQPDEKHSVFGKTGDTSSGHTARSLINVFRYAQATGSEEALEIGLKGLEYLDSQMRPEGAQTWELQLHVPDVLAAAHAIDCYVAAYELTRNESFLDQTRLWAYRGLPFIYLWNPADRPIMRYGSIPVFGATWFTGAWFGRIVQWNGLVYANSLLDLAEHDKSQDWGKIAEGITISGIQQQRPIDHSTYKFRDNIPDCGHAGMYPDAYSAVTGTDAYHWCLSGGRIAENVYKITGLDPAEKHTIVWSKNGKRQMNISSVAYIEDAALSDDALRFTATFHAHPYSKAHHIVVANLAEPVSVTKNGEALNQANDLDAASEGYQWIPQMKAVVIKIVQDSSDVTLKVR
ncbi:hypothetical protein ACFL6S_28040 [Candidatus Poribacteria bacterium]